MEIQSPVTGTSNTSLIREIDVSKIVALYQLEQQLNVSKYFGGLSVIQLRECGDTGYRFFYPMNIYGDDAFYQHLQKSGIYYLKEKWEYDKAASLIAENTSILEIGSGAGDFMSKLKGRNPAKLCGLELNTHQIETAKKNGLNVINENIEEFGDKNAGQFDNVCALQVLEHVPDVRSFLSSSLKALKTGGKLILCVPHNNPYLYRHDFFHTLNLPPHHAGLWDKQAFSKLPGFFPMRLNRVFIEPLSDYKIWYLTQVKYLKEKNNPAAGLLSLIPETIYKNSLRLMRHFIEGRNILVEFIKL